ncbi:helix-turn-helix transcriptional regulator [Candidatus Solirubrobacter pratensis]|uniref:helix-turn-helix transcriptional regulator n=1 Tax=Candidatus Solirubrobacter pratensis TaxID=1298857 RepID=UPI0006875B46|nr:helix-turn-helix transcriptional regulator [Candidatus Solirubrobacter pratensis]
MNPAQHLGEFLRARRELLAPEDVGLPRFGRRRVPGLRREELALLAGVSTDYLVRLEQGRDHHPSTQVLDALARALQLDEHATEHLHALGQPARPRPRARRKPKPERAPEGIVQLLASWPATPAFVHGRLMDVLAANPLAHALSPIYTPGVNLVRATFLDPGVRELYGNGWLKIAQSVVAHLRTQVGAQPEDPPFEQLVGELSVRSEEFRRLWARHDVQPRASGGITPIEHPQVGQLVLRYEKLAIAGGEGVTLVIYHAEPASSSAHTLQLLASMAASSPGHGEPGRLVPREPGASA